MFRHVLKIFPGSYPFSPNFQKCCSTYGISFWCCSALILINLKFHHLWVTIFLKCTILPTFISKTLIFSIFLAELIFFPAFILWIQVFQTQFQQAASVCKAWSFNCFTDENLNNTIKSQACDVLFFFSLSLSVIFTLNSRVNKVPKYSDCSTRAYWVLSCRPLPMFSRENPIKSW